MLANNFIAAICLIVITHSQVRTGFLFSILSTSCTLACANSAGVKKMSLPACCVVLAESVAAVKSEVNYNSLTAVDNRNHNIVIVL